MVLYITHLVTLLVATQIFTDVDGQPVTGCFAVDYGQPSYQEFGVSPCEYNVVDMTVAKCRALCAEFRFDYAGLRNGEFCFCNSESPTTEEDVTGASCNVDCSGDVAATCGGPMHMDVYPAGNGYVALAITPSVTSAASFDMVTFTVTAQMRPSSYNYQLEVRSPSYYTMLGVAGVNETFDVNLSMAGKLVVSVIATDELDPGSKTLASTEVTLDPLVHNVTLECPPIGITMEDVICNVSIVQGYGISLTVDYQDGTAPENVNILDPVRFGIGSNFLTSDPVSPTGTALGLHVVRQQVAEQAGKLVAIEYMAKAAGCTFTAMLVRVTCADPCPYTDSCTSCPEHTALADCATGATCYAPSVLHDVTGATVAWAQDVTTTAAGYGHTVIITPEDVAIGDVVGVFDGVGGCLETLPTVGSSTFYDSSVAATLSVNDPISNIPGFPFSNDVMIRFVVSAPTEVRLYHKYSQVGLYDVTVTAVANGISTVAPPSQVEILEGIDYVIIVHDEYHASTVSVDMVLDPHTGCGIPGNCNYTWDFGDGTVTVPVEDLNVTSHIYAGAGSYNICVTVENAVDVESNCSLIIIQDAIVLGTPVITPAVAVATAGTPSDYDLVLTSGTDANCTWSSTAPGLTDLIQQYAIAGTYTESLTFGTSGVFDIEISCANAISSASDTLTAYKVQSPVTRVALVTSQPVYVSTDGASTLDATSDGSDVMFDWTVDSTSYANLAGTQDLTTGDFTSQMSHTFSSPGSYQMTVKAFNDLTPLGQITPSITVTAQNPVPPDYSIASTSPVTIDQVGLVVTVSMPGGAALPTDATVTVRDADGNVLLGPEALTTDPFSTSDFQLPPPQGEQDIFITVENGVSQINQTATVASYHDLTDVSYTVQPKTAPNYVMPAGEFPMDTIIVSASTTGDLTHFTKFTLQYRRDGWLTPETREFDTPEFEHTFDKDGVYQVTVIGSNPVSSVQSLQTIAMIGGVRGLQVIALTENARVGSPVQYEIAFESFGTQSCVFFYHGDVDSSAKGSFFSPPDAQGSCIEQYTQHLGGGLPIGTYTYDGAITNPLTVQALQHAYNNEGTYDVKVEAYDVDETAVHRDTVYTAVSDQDCLNPDISFPHASMDRSAPDEHLASNDVILTAQLLLNCTAKKNIRQWSLYKLDPQHLDNDFYDVEVPLVDAAGMDQTTLVIRERSLAYGVYRADLFVEMVNDSSNGITFSPSVQFKSKESLYFRMEMSDIISNMLQSPFSAVHVGIQETFLLKPAAFSEDPDIPLGSPQGFTGFEYGFVDMVSEPNLNDPALECPILVGQNGINPTPNAGPFRGISQAAFKSGEIQIDTSQLDLGKWYLFCTTVFKDTRNATNKLLVEPSSTSQPDINIECVSSALCDHITTGIQVSATDDLVLAATCQPTSANDQPCGTASSGAAANKWLLEYYDAASGQWLELPDAASYITGDGTDKARISAAAFQSQPNLGNLRITVSQLTSPSDQVGSSPVQFLVTLNQPPTCNTVLEPDVGDFLDTEFLLNVTDCVDPEDGGVQSMVLYYAVDGSLRTLIGSAPLGGIETYLIGGNQPVLHNIVAIVTDIDGVAGEVHLGTVTVNPARDQARLEEFVFSDEAMSDLKDIMYAGSFEENYDQIITTVMTGNAIAEQRNHLLFSTAGNDCESGGFGCSSLPHLIDGTTEFIEPVAYAAFNEARDDLSRTFEVVAFSLGNSTTETLDQMLMKIRVISQITTYPENLVRDAQVSLVQTISDCAEAMVSRLEQLSPEQAKQAATDVIVAAGNMMTGCVVAMNNSVPRDVAQQQENYNTDLETMSDPRIDEPRTQEELASANKQQRKFQNFMEQKDSCAVQGSMLSDAKDKVVEVIASSLTPGEVFSVRTELVSQQIEAFTVAEYQQEIYRKLEGNVTVRIPPLTSLDPENRNSYQPEDHIVISNEVTAYNVLQYAATQHQIMPFTSRTIDVRISKNDDRTGYGTIKVDAATEDIHMILPRSVPPPNMTFIDPECPWISSYVSMVFTQIEVLQANSSVVMWLHVPREDTRFLVQWGMEDPPNITNGVWDYSQLVTVNDIIGDGVWGKQLEFGTDQVAGRNGFLYVALRELTEPEVTNIEAAEVDPERGVEVTLGMLEGSPNCSLTFSTLLIESPCYFNDGGDNLKVTGCKAGPLTTVDQAHCQCSHLTAFGGGFIVAPNPIDWSAVLANASFLDSPTIYSTIIAIFFVFFIAAVWARRKDMKDVERIGITPLQDNDPLDHYYYEVTVQTGRKAHSGTKSKVFMVVSGDWEETSVRELQDDKRQPFKLGATNYFLLSTPRPLGKLHYVRIWHDNSAKGHDQSWFLTYVIVHDLHTKAKYHFVCNQWLAVERGDCQIDRLLPVADRESMASFNILFMEKTAKDMSDAHIWFSVVGRPAISRFTRLQRVTCCLCVLFTAMLANVMWYGQDSSDTRNVLTIGPLALSPQQVGIGIMANLITFPINFLIVYLFRNTQPRRKRKSRVTTAIEKNKEEKKKQRKDSSKSVDQMALLNDDAGMLPFDLESRSVSQISRGSTTSFRGQQVAPPPELLPEDDFEYDEEGQRVKKKKKKKVNLPWWCVIIAWILSVLTIVACGVTVVLYGLSMGEQATQKWLGSMMISFLSSVLLTQPIKVVLVAAIFAMIFKTPSSDDDDEADRDEEPYELGWDEEWLHPPVDEEDGYARPGRLGYKPPDPVKLEADRVRRLKEIKMMEVIREIVIYSIFLWVLMIVCYDIRDPNAFFIKDNLVNVFVAENSIGPANLNNVQTLAHFWYYVEVTLTAGLRADKWYQGQEPYGQRGFMSDRASRIMGFAVMRQTRVPPGRCKTPSPLDQIIYECNIGYSIANEDTQSYGIDGWFSPVNGTCDVFPPHAYCYRGWKELNGYPWVGRANVYGGGGYVAEMRGSLEVLRQYTRRLEREGWVDKYTRAIFTEFTVYNAFVNMFGIVTILAEKVGTGGFLISYRVEPVNLIPNFTDFYLFTIVCQFAFCAFILYFIVRLILDLRKQKWKYFSSFWNWVEVWVIGLSFGSIVIYLYRYFVAKQLTNLFKVSHGNAYMKFQYVGWWNELLTYLVAWVVFLATIKFLLLLRFNKRMSLLGSTLQESTKSLSAFSVLFVVFFFAFVTLFYGIYGSTLLSYATLLISSETLLSTMLGKFDYDEMRLTAGFGGSVMFVLYICVMAFVILNMFVSILNESFAVVKDDVSKQNNDYEIVDFMLYKFKSLLGIAGPPPQSAKPKEYEIAAAQLTKGTDSTDVLAIGEPEQLPDRIDEFLERVTDLYFPGDPMHFKSKTKGNAASASAGATTYTEAEKKMIMKELEKDSNYRY